MPKILTTKISFIMEILKKNITTTAFLFLLSINFLYSQTEKRAINVVGSNVLLGEVYDYEYTFNSNGSSTFRLNSISKDTSAIRTFYDFEYDVFKLVCWDILKQMVDSVKDNTNLASSDLIGEIEDNSAKVPKSDDDTTPAVVKSNEKGKTSVKLNKEIDYFTSKIFFDIKSRLELDDDEPQVSFLKLKSNNIRCYYGKIFRKKIFSRLNYDGFPLDKIEFGVHNVQVEFEEGVIKNVFLDVFLDSIERRSAYYDTSIQSVVDTRTKYSKQILRFKNRTPISISSRDDDNYFSDYGLFLTDPDYISQDILNHANQKKNSKKSFGSEFEFAKSRGCGIFAAIIAAGRLKLFNFLKKDNLYISLADLIDYKTLLDVDREDYSPQNCVVELKPSSPVAELKKIKKSRILTSKAFSDFLGLQRENPNGLVQSEVSTRFLLNTTRSGEGSYNLGFASFVEPKLVFSKIEDNNRNILFDQADLDLTELPDNRKVFITNPVDLFRHQRFAFDIDFNLLKLNLTQIKSNFRINLSAGINQINSTDTINIINSLPVYNIVPLESIINNWKYGFTFMIEVKPERRYGIHFSYDWRRYNILNDGYTFPVNKNLLNTITSEAFIKTSDQSNSTIFFRSRLSFSNPIEEQNFLQLQVGFLFDIFKTKLK